MIDDKESDERYQIGEGKANEIKSTESETHEIYHMENP